MKLKLLAKILMGLLLGSMMSACGLMMKPDSPDPITGKLAAKPLPKQEITENRKLNLKPYAFLLVRGDLHTYQAGTLTNLDAFHSIIIPAEFGQYLVDKGYTNNKYDYFTMSNTTLQRLMQQGLRFLILDVSSIPFTIERETNYRLYDPLDDQTYFAIKHTAIDSTPGANYNACLNAVADWFKTNKSSV